MSPKIFATTLILIFIVFNPASSNKEIAEANSKFTTQIYKALSTREGNLLFSPLSLHSILSLAYQGASGNTSSAFTKALFVSAPSNVSAGYKSLMASLKRPSNVTLEIANKVYLKSGFKLKADFEKVAREDFSSEVEEIDFGDSKKAAAAINGWVEGKTNKKIKDLIEENCLDDLTRLVLINAIYFKAKWNVEFPKSAVRKEKFYVSEKEEIDVDMMRLRTDLRYGVNEELDAKIVELPYKNPAFSLIVVLPNKKYGLRELEGKLENVDIASLSRQLIMTEIDLSLPRFKIETNMDLNETLNKVGLEIIFSETADFSGFIETTEKLYVSKVVQKAFIEVNEEGAEAAVATGMLVQARSGRVSISEVQIVVDHPFIFYIVYSTSEADTILFLGRVTRIPVV